MPHSYEHIISASEDDCEYYERLTHTFDVICIWLRSDEGYPHRLFRALKGHCRDMQLVILSSPFCLHRGIINECLDLIEESPRCVVHLDVGPNPSPIGETNRKRFLDVLANRLTSLKIYSWQTNFFKGYEFSALSCLEIRYPSSIRGVDMKNLIQCSPKLQTFVCDKPLDNEVLDKFVYPVITVDELILKVSDGISLYSVRDFAKKFNGEICFVYDDFTMYDLVFILDLVRLYGITMGLIKVEYNKSSLTEYQFHRLIESYKRIPQYGKYVFTYSILDTEFRLKLFEIQDTCLKWSIPFILCCGNQIVRWNTSQIIKCLPVDLLRELVSYLM